MASNSAKSKGSRWGSLLSGAVAGLESRLDTIFAEEEERAAKEKEKEKAAALSNPSAQPATHQSNAPTTTSSNHRLKERLAKAVAKSSSQPPSEVPSRSATPLLDPGTPAARPSVDLPSSSAETSAPPTLDPPNLPQIEPSSTLLTSSLPINPARISVDRVRPPSNSNEEQPNINAETNGDSELAPLPAEADNATSRTHDRIDPIETERQEEMDAHLERIDALQAKLQYLARETVAAAKEANANAKPASIEQKLAEKDERIALLMEEGNKLSKTEMRNLAVIKRLRSKAADEEKTMTDLHRKVERLEASETDLKQKLKVADQAEKLANERLRRLQKLEKELETTRTDLESSKATISALRKQLSEAETRADQAERTAQKNASQLDSQKFNHLQDQIAHLKIEKKLAEDRIVAETRQSTEQIEQLVEKASVREAELMAEASIMESRIEALRSRAEEATSEVTGDAQAKLLRQIETLQTQYSLAAENWRTIEASLNGRIVAIEKERDEVVKREADMRKKARDVSNKSKRNEEELEKAAEESQKLVQELQTRTNEVRALQTRLATAEKSLEDIKADFDRQRRVLESEFEQKLDEEKSRRTQHSGLGINTDMGDAAVSRAASPTNTVRKGSGHDHSNSMSARRGLQRMLSQDQHSPSLPRRTSAMGTPTFSSPIVSRQGSTFSLSQLNGLTAGMPPAPSIHTTAADDDDGLDGRSSPQRTINDVISASTVHTGPSVQLVERMSSSIRRLESEKAAHKDELARLLAQRDESRNEVVTLMREAESKRQADARASKMEAELVETRKRLEACLLLLGEKEEQVEDLEGDVVELKRIYRDLADRSLK